jgi:hypothetical protein
MDLKTAREIRVDVVEESRELLVPVPSVAIADGDSACHIQRRER